MGHNPSPMSIMNLTKLNEISIYPYNIAQQNLMSSHSEREHLSYRQDQIIVISQMDTTHKHDYTYNYIYH